MPLILATGPAAEPVTLAEAKAHLRIETPQEDTLIASLILAARLFVERSLDVALITQHWSLYLDRWPADGAVPLPLPPVQAVTFVRVYDDAGNAQTVAPDQYQLDAVSAPPRLRHRLSAHWPQPGRRMNGVEIGLKLGFGDSAADVPAPLRQAILLLVSHWYEIREPVLLDTDVVDAPLTVAALLAPYRKVRLR
jgi:uncharacterized phiE125 gp8 family phage protein